MCQSHKVCCACGQRTAEIFFGHMIFDESVIEHLYCPDCGKTAELDAVSTVEDNGWVLSLDEDIMKALAVRAKMTPDEITAEKVFDGDYVTWVGFSPEDNMNRAKEREKIVAETADDKKAQFAAMKNWAIEREKSFFAEGWRKTKKAHTAA